MKRKGGGQPGNKNTEKWPEDRALKLGNDLIQWMKDKPQNIWYEEFLHINNDYSANILQYLANKFTSFSELKKRAHAIQCFKMQKYANNKMINPTIAIFSLKNNHGWTDRLDQTTMGEKIDNKIQVEILKPKKE